MITTFDVPVFDLLLGDPILVNERKHQVVFVDKKESDPDHFSLWRSHTIMTLSNGNKGLYWNEALLPVAEFVVCDFPTCDSYFSYDVDVWSRIVGKKWTFSQAKKLLCPDCKELPLAA